VIAPPATVKLVVWDLDNTLWDGTLLEGDRVALRPGVRDILATLDQHGILHSVASRSDYELAWRKLAELGLADYFLYPQINWNSKSGNIKTIIDSINISADTVVFIDDDPFEREEVRRALPQLSIIDAAAIDGLTDLPGFTPAVITEDAARRRQMYQADRVRKEAEESFVGAQEDFLASLAMKLAIAPARDGDLRRVEELVTRTNQLNTTGYTYSYDELNGFRQSADHVLLIASLEDTFGTYGKIGMALIDKSPGAWTIKLLIMSCRVMSRGVGTIFLNHIIDRSRRAGVSLRAEFRSTGRNRMMLVTYKFGGFREVARSGDLVIFEHDGAHFQRPPAYVDVRAGDESET